MGIVRLDQKQKRVKVGEFEISNEFVFEYINSLPEDKRDETLTRAIYIGVLAMKEDRLAAFLAKTKNELGTELEHLKQIFEFKVDQFYESTQKGAVAEEEIAGVLQRYLAERRWKDQVQLTGNTAGTLAKNKTGDIVCGLDGHDDRRLVIECKFDKSIKLGDIGGRDVFARRGDTAWSQLLEAQVNRDGRVSLIVFDANLMDSVLAKEVDAVSFVPGIGFIVVIDSLKGDYRPLLLAYSLARQIALAAKEVDLRDKLLALLVKRMLQATQSALGVRKLVEQNIETSQEILRQLNQPLLLLEFTQEYLERFLENGTLTPKDLLEFYQGEEAKEKFAPLEKEIKKLAGESEKK